MPTETLTLEDIAYKAFPEADHRAKRCLSALEAAVAEERKALREMLIEHGVSSSLAVRDVLDDLMIGLDARESKR